MNAAAEELTGRRAKDALDHPLSEVFPIVSSAGDAEAADPVARVRSATNGAAPVHHSILLCADGSRVPIDESAAAIRTGDAALAGIVMTFRRGAREGSGAPETRNIEAQEDFFAILAHELRNPLAPIRNALQIMQVVQDAGATTAAARVIIERQLKHLTRLIDDLLDMAQVTQGKLELRKARTSLSAVVQHALAIARPQLESKQHRLQIDVPKDLFLSADETHLAQAFANLLHNASKYSAMGSSIRMAARAEQEEIIMQVNDEGVGIDPEKLGSVFDLYGNERADEHTHDGLGIGLSLVKRIVALHGGAVTAVSAGRGLGSEFTVRLPKGDLCGTPDVEQRTSTAAATGQHLRILVADDNRDAAHTLAMLLTLEGHEVRAVHDGIEALAMGDDFVPQLIFLDIGMPLLDGYETARQIREREWGAHTHLVALTGWGQEEDRRKALAAGFQDHLVKPAELDAMKAIIDRIVDE
jgi:signal transduction histidine kinase/ActR/RegA family two-component response regulator